VCLSAELPHNLELIDKTFFSSISVIAGILREGLYSKSFAV